MKEHWYVKPLNCHEVFLSRPVIQLPLYNLLRQDEMWHVRHSSIFALPALLSHLPIRRRRRLEIEATDPLSKDDSAIVRSGLLEALGEIIHTFHGNPDGPPQELLDLFIGHIGQVARSPTIASLSAFRITAVSDPSAIPTPPPLQSPLEAFFSDPARPLICAFSLPAIALTLGGEQWHVLRPLYEDLAVRRTIKVRRTLAASVGELAKIIGPAYAFQDLLPVWIDAINCEDDSDVRLNAVEAVEALLDVLAEGSGKESVANELVKVWRQGNLKGWRERRTAVHALLNFFDTEAQAQLVVEGTGLALQDTFAGVREAAIELVRTIIL